MTVTGPKWLIRDFTELISYHFVTGSRSTAVLYFRENFSLRPRQITKGTLYAVTIYGAN